MQQSLIRARANHVRTEALAQSVRTVMSASARQSGSEKTAKVSVVGLMSVFDCATVEPS